jgi:hypothetical protein
VVTADGQLLRCSEREHADLFWALRGGGGGNFGVCTSFTLMTKPVDHVTLYDIEWDWADAAVVFAAFQDVMSQAPDEFSARIGVGRAGNPQTGGTRPPVISALGQFFGSRTDLVELLAPALRVGRIKKQLIARRTHNGDGAGAAMFAFGGAINRVPADATAFVHRDKFAVLATEAEWTPQDAPRTVARNLSWIKGLAAGLQPHVSGSAYQNFMDRSQPDWQHAYYGKNFRRLTEIKRRVDPSNLFRFEQSIPLSDGRN